MKTQKPNLSISKMDNNEKEGRRMSRNVFEEQSEGKNKQKKRSHT
jgi:hypothetical protein